MDEITTQHFFVLCSLQPAFLVCMYLESPRAKRGAFEWVCPTISFHSTINCRADFIRNLSSRANDPRCPSMSWWVSPGLGTRGFAGLWKVTFWKTRIRHDFIPPPKVSRRWYFRDPLPLHLLPPPGSNNQPSVPYLGSARVPHLGGARDLGSQQLLAHHPKWEVDEPLINKPL